MKKFLLYFVSLFVGIGCQDTLTVIKGCCEEPALEKSVGIGRIFVPNVFTPNNDGINDRFIIYGDSIMRIKSIIIKNKDRDIVFEINDILVNDYQTAWDGEFAGKVVSGMYSYELAVEAIDYTLLTFKGKVCICPCIDTMNEEFVPLRGCDFSPCNPANADCNTNEDLPCFEN